MKLAMAFVAVPMLLMGTTVTAQEYLGQSVCRYCHRNLPYEGFFQGYIDSGHPWKVYHSAGRTPSPNLWPHTPVPPLPVVGGMQLIWEDVEYVIGNFYWKTRFVDHDGYIYTGNADETTQWNIQTEEWVPYHAGEVNKPFNCGRCHTTGYNPEGNQNGMPGLIGTWVFEGIKCEACHGPGSEHANSYGLIPTPGGKQCAECHYRDSQFRMPWKGGFMRHHQQSEDLTHSAHKEDLTCESCHNPHKSVVYNEGGVDVSCNQCHEGDVSNGFYVVAGMESVSCKDCHMPFMAKSAVKFNEYTGDIRGHLVQIMTEPIAAADNVYDVGGSLFWNQDQNGDSFVTLDYSCLGCHIDINEPLTLEEAAAFAEDVHNRNPAGRITPDVLDVIYGAYRSGGVGDLFFSDDQYVVIEQRPALSVLLPLIRVELTAVAPTDVASRLLVTMEAGTTAIPVRPPQKLFLYDYDAGTWELLDERIATFDDSVVEISIDTNPGRFIEAGTNEMQMRLGWFDPGNVFSPAWVVRIDQAVWNVIP